MINDTLAVRFELTYHLPRAKLGKTQKKYVKITARTN